MRILIVEDDNDVATSLYEFLEKCGYIVDAAADGVTGLHLATVGTFDAIVLDVALPGLDGLELSRQLREVARKTTPVLMLTARDALSDKLAGFKSGADDYLVKPFALAELDARLKALVKRSSGRMGARELRVRDLCLNLGVAMTIEDSWGGDIVTAAIAALAHSTPPEFLFTATDFNSYVTQSIASGAPQRQQGRMAASDLPGLGIEPRMDVLGEPMMHIV